MWRKDGVGHDWAAEVGGVGGVGGVIPRRPVIEMAFPMREGVG